jgi:hypothetical protein
MTDFPLTETLRMIDEDSKIDRLDRFGKALLSKRQKAIAARKKSGIEAVWDEDLEYYSGIDDANRGEARTAVLNKESIERRGFSPKKNRNGSNVFINITKQYSDVASDSLCDMLLPTNEANYELIPTPKPSTMELLKARPVGVGVVEYQGQQMPVADFEDLLMQQAQQKAKNAQKQIDDWLTEANWHREVRKVVKDAAKIGVGIMKGCYPIAETKRSFHEMNENTAALAISKEIKPASKRIDPRDFFPDPSCRDNIHNGSYVWERDYVTAKQLRELREHPGYIASQIEKVLKDDDDVFSESKTKNKDSYEIWYFYGQACAEDLKACDCELEEGKDGYDVIVVMVGERVIKATMNPLESGEFPYDVMVWQPMTDTWTGIGVSRQVREPQRIINAATRNLLDNAGRGGRPTMLIADGVEAADGGLIEVGSGNLLRISPDSAIQDARGAISSVVIPIITQDLMAIIQYALKMAEDITGLPMLLQGQQGNAPDTVGGMTMLQNNAGTIRRNIARNFDDLITTPHIHRYYEWLMLFGDESCKGDFNIEARGSSVLFERDAQSQAILQMGQLVMNPAFQINPAKWFDEACKAQKIDPKRIKFTEEEIKEQQAAMQQQGQPQDPRVAAQLQIAQMKAQSDMQVNQAKAAAEMDKVKFNQSTDMAELEIKESLAMSEFKFKAEQARLDREHLMSLKMIERDLKIMELSQQSQLTVAQIKAQLAQTSQKLNVQTTLSKQPSANAATKQVVTPPTEPAGRADTGRAFEK